VTTFKRFCLMAGGAQIVGADINFNAGRFWAWAFNLAALALLLYLSKPSKEGE
jgi:hypothetical protein